MLASYIQSEILTRKNALERINEALYWNKGMFDKFLITFFRYLKLTFNMKFASPAFLVIFMFLLTIFLVKIPNFYLKRGKMHLDFCIIR